MLQLHHYNNRIIEGASNNFTRYDYNFFNTSRVRRLGLPRTKSLDHACLPFLMNGINLKQKTCMYDSTWVSNDDFETIKAFLNTQGLNETTDYNILRLYTAQEDMDAVCTILLEDVYIEVPDAIKTLYNTCAKQTEARRNAEYTYNIRVLKSKVNHTLVLVLNFDDIDQASDMYLTIGLTPILFEDYKEMFCQEEMDYFSTLVKRSQVKRINNAIITGVFGTLTRCAKYINILRNETTKYILSNIMNTKIAAYQRDYDIAANNAARALNNYDQALKQYYKLQKEIQLIQNNQDNELEEIKTAVNIPAVYKLDQSTRSQYEIDITLTTTCSFYELDEVECIMNRINSDTVFYKFIKDVFIDQKYKLHLGHTFHFDFDINADFNAANTITLDELEQMSCMCNPHLFGFNCMGDYKPKLIDATRKQDLTMFINFAIASLKSINFRDGAVINRWKDMFLDMTQHWNNGTGRYKIMAESKCLEDAEGNRLSIADLYLQPAPTPVDAPTLEVEEL